MKLVSDSKNERITQLLKETDNYLAELGGKVLQQKAALAGSSGGVDEAGSADGPADSSDGQPESIVDKYSERSQYYKLRTRWPSRS